MAIYTEKFLNDTQSLNTSISYIVTIGEHDSFGLPIEGSSLCFGSIEKSLDLLPTSEKSLIIHPLVSSNINISKTLNMDNHSYVVSKVSLKLANSKIDANKKYTILSDILSNHFPNSSNLKNNSVLNSFTKIWVMTGSCKSMSMDLMINI